MMIGIVGAERGPVMATGALFLANSAHRYKQRESSGTSFVKGASPHRPPVYLPSYLPTWRRMNRQERDATSVTVFTAPLVSFIRIGPSVNESQRIIDRKPSFSRRVAFTFFSHRVSFPSLPLSLLGKSITLLRILLLLG